MATLYVTEQGARVEKEYRRVLVTKGDEVLLRVPVARVDHVVLVGRVGATTPAMLSLLDEGVSLSFVSRWGKLRGRLTPPTAKNIPLRHRHYQRALEPDFCLAVSRAFVAGKLRNCRNLARRYARRRPKMNTSSLAGLDNALADVEGADSLAALRGLEGVGTRAYFAILRQMLDPEAGFRKRTRRPPTDPANALMSLGYSLLSENMMTACEVVGLDPYDGFLHSDRYGRPALALDLMEEFRAVIVDSVVLNLLNRNRLNRDDFQPGPEGGVYLKRQKLGIFFSAYGKKLHQEVVHPVVGRRLSYQKCFEIQARSLRKVIEGSVQSYLPFLTR